jgi:hypothetical protein
MPYYAVGDYYGGRGDYYRGDPGFLKNVLGGIVGGVKGLITGGPTGAVIGAARGYASAATGKQPPGTNTTLPGPQIVPPARGLVGGPPGGVGIGYFPQGGGGVGMGYFPPGPGGGGPVGTMDPGQFGQFIPGLCGMKGTHTNKSSYFKQVPGNPLAGVRIPKGTVCVKNRRMNPANGRAVARALRRAYAFKNMAMRTIRLLNAGQKAKRFGGFKKRRRKS